LPKKDGLIEFFVSGASSFRFFIDPASLSVGPDNVVRYTLVARSASGYENISYEGIRCGAGSYKVFAFGNDGQWKRSSSEWQEILPKSVQRWHNVLRGNFFCPQRYTIQTAAEGIDALRRGAHPLVKNDGSGGGGR
jgi:CNP1-like family